MLLTPTATSSNGSPESSSSDMRNTPYMTFEWQACPPEVATSHRPTPGPSSSSSHSHSHHIAPSTDKYGHDSSVSNTPLISPSSHSRLLPPLAGLPADARQLHPPPTATLYSHQFHYPPQLSSQNVLPLPLNASSTRDPPEQSPSHGSPFFDIESFSLPSNFQTQHVSVNAPSTRPRTSHPVFHSTSALAAHHGIPQSLPPVPRTTKFASVSPPAASSAPAPPVASSSSPDFDFSSLCSNYLTMLKQKPEETHAVPDISADAETVQAIMDVIQGVYDDEYDYPSPAHTGISASPEFRMANEFSEYLTSPMEDSPYDDFLTTPALGSADMSVDMLTSPAIYDADTFPELGDTSLFGVDGLGLDQLHAKSSGIAPPAAPLPHPSFDFDGMYTMPSPTTPSLDPTSLHPSPHQASGAMPSPARRLRKSLPTGTRKNITPDALVGIDAPIQKRTYVTPSATSRKEVPVAWLKKKRARSQAFGEEDELEEDVSVGANDLDAIEAKRRQNTLAARRSRKRKLEYQRDLEASVEREKEEKEMWRQRAMLFKALLESHGHEVPSFEA